MKLVVEACVWPLVALALSATSVLTTSAPNSPTTAPLNQTSTTKTSTTTTTAASPTTTAAQLQHQQDQETKSISESATFVVSEQAQISPNDERFSEAANSFALNFLKKYSANERGNFVYSPLSLQSLLDMLLLGAKQGSQVEYELLATLGFAPVHETNNNNDNGTNKALFAPSASAETYSGYQRANVSEAHATLKKLTTELSKLSSSASSSPKQASHAPATADTQASGSEQELTFALRSLILVNNETCKLTESFEKELSAFHELAKIEKFERSKLKQKLDVTINDWVKNATNSKISKIVDASDVEASDTVFVNAAYFKASWLQTFKLSATSSKPFLNNGDESKKKETKFMSQHATFGFVDFNENNAEDDLAPTQVEASGKQTATTSQPTTANAPFLNCSVLSMPFSINDGQELSMTFFLPTKRDGLDELIEALNSSTLNMAYKFLVDQQVQVELPKFSFESSAPAKSILTAMGLGSVFSYSQDLSAMLATPVEAKLDNVIHKAQVAIDETGAEAAAASSATIIIRNFVPMSKSRFVADHPFLFVIRHNKSNLPLFVGKVVEF